MSILLEQAVAKVRALSEAEQDAIAAVILAEIEDDERWNVSFAKAPEKLAALVARAEQQVQAGECLEAGLDEL